MTVKFYHDVCEADKLGARHGVLERMREDPSLYAMRLLWDEAAGFRPDHPGYGYVEWSVRPYRQGYGCDGTTDGSIHLIAHQLCEMVGLDYVALYADAYPGECIADWIGSSDYRFHQEHTVVPQQAGERELRLMLCDLYEINNRSLVRVLEGCLGLDEKDWYAAIE